MAIRIEDELFRPYAPPANVVAVLQRVRRMNMPVKISREFLIGASISTNIVPRVSGALRFLGLVDTEDRPTDALRVLASSTEDEYQQLLEQMIRTAYATDFQNINPATDPQQKIIDTFQRYTPKSQHSRQVMLLLGLCREAGMEVFDLPRERQMQQRGRTKRTQRHPQPRRTDAREILERRTREESNLPPSGLLFGVTEDDIAALPTEEFDEVWKALGKVALARATARGRQAEQQDSDTGEEEAGGEP